MKTAEEYAAELQDMCFAGASRSDIIQFLADKQTEHDNEIKELIDEMIERKKWLISNEPRPDGDFKAIEKQIEINILTELKTKIDSKFSD